jgi:uncharacterized protein DUF4331
VKPRGTVLARVRTERKLTCKEENVSDHLDAPGLKSPNMDARVDITDIFAFQNPADPTRSVLAMNVNPVAPTLANSFAPEAVYELILDTDGDTVADVTYRVTFSPRENDDQRATVRRATGEEVWTAEISGELLFRDVPVSFDGDAGVVESGNHEFFVGIRSDPFFFDLEGFQHDFEMPNTALGEGQVGFWCRVLGPENGDLSQIDRMGRPLTNMLYTEGEDKNAFNQVGPEQDRDLFLETFEAVLEANGYGSGEARTIAQTLLPDVLAYDHRAAAAFPNGRKLDDDIIDTALDLFTNGRITSDGVSPHRDMLYSFPYLGAPHPTPDGSTEGDA